ncbi:hypothetical protein EOD39_18795 [Acipenser ruthenus]|uniref:Uncharacterized protein n=1 Tax=Acipenser ruthenus TaxID=7906 RepID=A0A444UZU5_ACIRT|nr:hypothetical protein EOD39_18795 [Acipenser ruthenus]
MAITIFFSTVLGVAVLVFIMYSLNKCKRKSAQYSHRPLYNTADETGERFELNSSEMAITIFFSTILGVAVLVFIMYSLNKCKRKSAQYSHRPLYNTADETVHYSRFRRSP